MVQGTAVLELHDETRDGLRVFHVDSGRQTTRATLAFRVGMADETLATSGWTHLLEHLALHGWSDPRLGFNASVGLYTTRFDLDGETDVVHEHLERLGRWLAEPDLSHLELEARVLRAESERRPGSAIEANLEWRFGAGGPGLVAYRELGLSRAAEHALRGWARRVFTAGNAVLATDTPLPEGFRHGLPQGTALPDAPLAPVASAPRGYFSVGGGVVGSAVVRRSDAAAVAVQVLQRRLTETLRDASGASYAPWADYERVDASTALLTFGSDVSTEGRQTAACVVVDTVTELASTGPTTALLDDLAVARERAMRDPVNAPGAAWSAALSWLSDGPIASLEEAAQRARAVTPDEVAEVFGEVRRTLVLGLPHEGRKPASLHELRQPVVPLGPLDETFRHADGATTISLGSTGLQSVGPGHAIDVRWSDVVGLMTYPDGARVVLSRLGWHVTVEPALVRHGDRLVREVDGRVPEELVLAQPARSEAEVPARRSGAWWARRRAAAFTRRALDLPWNRWWLWTALLLGGKALYHLFQGR